MALLLLLLLPPRAARGIAADERVAPNASLGTIPVGYYGGLPERPAVNIDMLSRMRIVSLMQEDGPAWPTCCPKYRQQTMGRCDSHIVNATQAYPACNASLDQHMYQDSVFARVKARAVEAGRPLPHCLLYLNAALLFPFDIDSADRSLFFRDINGQPHVEAADPAILTYFWGFSNPMVHKAWVDVIRRATHSDGVYADNFDSCAGTSHTNCSGITMGVSAKYRNPYGMFYNCSTDTNTCLYLRANHNSLGAENRPSVVSLTQAHAYVDGLHATLRAAARYIEPGIFTAKTLDATKPFNGYGAPYGANTAFGAATNIQKILANGFKYVITFGTAGYQNPLHNASDIQSACSEGAIAWFLLHVEEGAFLICNGWDPAFDRPLGRPLGPNGVAPRKFEFGAEVQCNGAAGCRVVWPGVSPTPWPPPPPAPQPPPPRTNYLGCYHDHKARTVCDLPCLPDGSSGGCTNPCVDPRLRGKGCVTKHGGKFLCSPPFARMTLAVCNQKCAEMGAKYFGVQAGHACFCGDTYGHQGLAPKDSLCNTKCAGNSSEICGGSDLNSIYSVSLNATL